MKVYGGVDVEIHIMLRWVVSFKPRPLYPWRKSPRYPLDKMLGGPQNQFEQFEKRQFFTPIGSRTATPRSSSP
jgi:hypothetical protein